MKLLTSFFVIIAVFLNNSACAQTFSEPSEHTARQAQQWAHEAAQTTPEEQQLVANLLYFSITTAYAGLLARSFMKRILGIVRDVFECTFRLQDQLYPREMVGKSFGSFLKLASDYRWAHDSWKGCREYFDQESLSPQLRSLYATLLVDSNDDIRAFIQNDGDKIDAFMYDAAVTLASQGEMLCAEADKLYKAVYNNAATTEHGDPEYDKVNATKLTADLAWKQSWNGIETACDVSQLQEALEARAMDTLALYYKELLTQMEAANILEHFGRIMFDENGIIPEEKRKKKLPKILGDEI